MENIFKHLLKPAKNTWERLINFIIPPIPVAPKMPALIPKAETKKTPLYRAAFDGKLKELSNWDFSAEELGQKDEHGSNIWHMAAWSHSLKCIPRKYFTSEALNQKDKKGRTCWHIAAKKNGFRDIPLKLFTTEALNQKAHSSSTVWHYAAHNDTLKDIPQNLFNVEALNQTNKDGSTVWHIAAKMRTLIDIPQHLFTVDALNQKDQNGFTVWYLALQSNTLQDIPKPLTEGFLNGKSFKHLTDDLLLTEKLSTFLESNPNLKIILDVLDPRLNDVSENGLSLTEATEGKILLKANGEVVRDTLVNPSKRDIFNTRSLNN